jgi:hypothetical protein
MDRSRRASSSVILCEKELLRSELPEVNMFREDAERKMAEFRITIALPSCRVFPMPCGPGAMYEKLV